MELILLDEDLDYAQSIRDFLQQWDGGFGITFKQFTKPEAAVDYTRRNRTEAVLLVAERYAEYTAREPVAAIILMDRPDAAGERALSRFQPLEQLMQEANRALFELHVQLERQVKGTRIAGWFSAAGGCGKSTAAYNLAMQLAQRGEDVCFIGLESLPSALLLGETGESRMSEWLYFAKTKPKLAEDRAATLLLLGPHRNLQVVAPFGNTVDAFDMNEADVGLLLNALREQNAFTWIVVDGETGWSSRQKGAALRCDLSFWIVTDDTASVNKTGKLLEEWRRTEADDFASGVCWTAGKYVGVAPGGCDRLGVEAEALLPYVPRWKSVKRAEELLSADFYSQQLWHAFQTAADRRRKGGNPGWSGINMPS